MQVSAHLIRFSIICILKHFRKLEIQKKKFAILKVISKLGKYHISN